MKSAKRLIAIGLAWNAIILPALAGDLDIGSQAPKLTADKWIKGEAVDLATARGKQITVVEFWATWCPPCIASVPHLTKLQHRYADGSVRVVGITESDSRNPIEKVRQFVERMGDKMDYTVGFDTDGHVIKSYMEAAGLDGIPTAFVVDKNGTIAWIGFPDEALDEVVAELVAGKFDIEVAKHVAKIEGRIEEAQMFGEWDMVIDLLDEVIKVKPQDPRAWMRKFDIYANYTGNVPAAQKSVKRAFELSVDSPDRTAEIANTIITDADPDGFNKLADDSLTRAATTAPDHTGIRVARVALFAARGRDDEALALAADTIDRLKGDAEGLSWFAGVLSSPARAAKCGDLALRAIELAIKAETDEAKHYVAKFFIQNECKNDIRGANNTGHYVVQKAAQDADFLNGFAWGLLTDESTKGKFATLALAAAETMYKAPGGDGWSPMDTLALARFENGDVDGAIAIQKQAIAKCDNDHARASLKDALQRYEEAKKK